MASAGFANDVGSRQLPRPSVANVDFAIAKAVAIANEEVVAKALVPPTEVLPVNGLGCAEWIAKVVNDNAAPTLISHWLVIGKQQIKFVVILLVGRVYDVCQRKAANRCWRVQCKEGKGGRHRCTEASENHLRPTPWRGAGCVLCHRRVTLRGAVGTRHGVRRVVRKIEHRLAGCLTRSIGRLDAWA